MTAIKRGVDRLRVWWTCESTVYESGVWPPRPREQHEYPEAQRRYWRATVQEIDEIMDELRAARAYAVEQYARTEPVKGTSGEQ